MEHSDCCSSNVGVSAAAEGNINDGGGNDDNSRSSNDDDKNVGDDNKNEKNNNKNENNNGVGGCLGTAVNNTYKGLGRAAFGKAGRYVVIVSK